MAVIPLLKNKSSVSNTEGRLIPRKVQFDWAETPLEWIPGQPFASHFINEINMILPAGEFWFCRLYNKALPYVTDDKLRDDIQMFIRQEAMHARAHGGAIAEYLKAHGIETERNTKIMEWLFEDLLADNPLGIKMPKLLEKRWLVFRLGIIAAVEHMTCVLGNYALDNKKWDEVGADPVLLDLLRWHGAEEVEHRSVAFDLYQHLGGGYVSRYYLSTIVVPLVIGLWTDGAAHLINQDPRFADEKLSVWKPKMWLRWAKESKSGHLPHPLRLVAWQLPFFSPWYDPVKEGSTEKALASLNNSPAAAAAASATQRPLTAVK